jgi:hypothetical protein
MPSPQPDDAPLNLEPPEWTNGPDEGWCILRETWPFYRDLYRLHGIVLEYGDYTRMWRAVRKWEAECVLKRPLIFRVVHERTGTTLLVSPLSAESSDGRDGGAGDRFAAGWRVTPRSVATTRSPGRHLADAGTARTGRG